MVPVSLSTWARIDFNMLRSAKTVVWSINRTYKNHYIYAGRNVRGFNFRIYKERMHSQINAQLTCVGLFL